MEYDDMIIFFLEELPDIKPMYNEVKELLEDALSPHVFCGTVLNPYIIRKLNNNEKEKLQHIFNLLERLAVNDDEMIQEILSVGILESLVHERNTIDVAKEYMLANTKKVCNDIEAAFGWSTVN